jgi:hypothetical protein
MHFDEGPVSVEPHQIASLVHAYLQTNGYTATMQALQSNTKLDPEDMIIEPPPTILTKTRSMSAVVSEQFQPVQLSSEGNLCGI